MMLRKDRLLLVHASRIITQTAKKIKAFEAQTIVRRIQVVRGKITGCIDEVKRSEFQTIEKSYIESLKQLRELDVHTLIIPQALRKMGLSPQCSNEDELLASSPDKVIFSS